MKGKREMKRIHIEFLMATLIIFTSMINILLLRRSVISIYPILIAVIIQFFGTINVAMNTKQQEKEE